MPYVKKDIIEVFEKILPEVELVYSESDKPFYIGKCPFHNDRNPSFAIFPLTQKWICYSCHPEWGDVIDLVRTRYGCGFVEAQRIACTEVANETFLFQSLMDSARKVEKQSTPYKESHVLAIIDRIRELQKKKPRVLRQNLAKFDILFKQDAYMSIEQFIRKLEHDDN